MTRQAKAVLGVLVAAGALGMFAATAAAQSKSGNEKFDGTIVARATAGDRIVLSSVVHAKGVFHGNGHVVEIPNLPSDGDDILRDDFVFKSGTMHVITTVVDAEFLLDPKSCILRATIAQTAVVSGGTGAFAAASGSFSGTLRAKVKEARNPDGSCSEDTSLNEVDHFTAEGTLTY